LSIADFRLVELIADCRFGLRIADATRSARNRQSSNHAMSSPIPQSSIINSLQSTKSSIDNSENGCGQLGPARKIDGVRKPLLALGVVLALTIGVGAQGPAQGKSFLWKVQSRSGVLFLAGSIHALTPDAYPLSPAYQRAFDAAGALVEEIDLAEANPLTSGPALIAKGTYQDGRTFDAVVSPETAALVADRLQGIPMVMNLIQPMKPWMVMLLIEALSAQAAGLDPQLGLDKHFYDMADRTGKTVMGLETLESQVDRFDRMPEALQEKLLRSELAEQETERTGLRSLVTAWKTGDAASVEATLLAGFRDNPEAYASLVTERNRNWMPQLEACLVRASPCFVVVGAAHLVGPDGLLAMLRARGYGVEQQ